MSQRALPLAGINVVEFAGLAPSPMAGLVLADFGASVTRIDGPATLGASDVLSRGKRSIALNVKIPEGRAIALKLVESADVLIEPFRPGVMERLGLGPDVFLDQEGGKNKKLVYARLVGFSRTGAHKNMAGHDLNYLALSGVLSLLPGEGKPVFPLNLLADFGGGGVMCALGIVLALIERQNSGLGQIVHTDMVSGTRYLASYPLLSQLRSATAHAGGPRGTNLLDGGAPHYAVYVCADGSWMSVACIEPRFFATFFSLFCAALPARFTFAWPDADGGAWPTATTSEDRQAWPRLRAFLAQGFLTNTRDYWADVFHGSDACTVPVLTPEEAAKLRDVPSMVPAPHPVLARTPSPAGSGWDTDIADNAHLPFGRDTEDILGKLGLSEAEIRRLEDLGAVSIEGNNWRTSAKL